MIKQLKLEFLKLIRSRGFYLSFAALAGFVALMLWGFYSYAERKLGGARRRTSQPVQIHLRIQELFQRSDLRPLLGDLLVQPVDTNLRRDERRRRRSRARLGRALCE